MPQAVPDSQARVSVGSVYRPSHGGRGESRGDPGVGGRSPGWDGALGASSPQEKASPRAEPSAPVSGASCSPRVLPRCYGDKCGQGATEGLLETLHILGMMLEVVKKREEREGVRRSKSQWGLGLGWVSAVSQVIPRLWGGSVLWDEGTLGSRGGSVLCPSSSRICGVGLCHVPGHPACVGWLSAVGWGHAVLMGQDSAVSRVTLAVCPVSRHARFTGGSALPHPGADRPPLPPPSPCRPHRGHSRGPRSQQGRRHFTSY